MNERPAVTGRVAVPNEHLCRLEGNCLPASIKHPQVHPEPGTPAVHTLSDRAGAGRSRAPTGGLHSFSSRSASGCRGVSGRGPTPRSPGSARGLGPAPRTPAGACQRNKRGGRASGPTTDPKLQPSVPSDGPGPPRLPGAPPALAEPRRSQRAMRASETLPEPPSPDPRLGQRAPQCPAA